MQLTDNNEQSECCGAHEVCEHDSLLSTNDRAIYFDDEVLDELSGKNPKEMTEDDLNKIRSIFYYLNEDEIAPWLRSLNIRNIQLPFEIREQALLIISERRL